MVGAFSCLPVMEEHQVQQERSQRHEPTPSCLLQVAAGRIKDVAAHYRTLVTQHADDWELLLSFLDVTLPAGQGAASSQPLLDGLEQVSTQATPGSQVRGWRPDCKLVMSLASPIRHTCGVIEVHYGSMVLWATAIIAQNSADSLQKAASKFIAMLSSQANQHCKAAKARHCSALMPVAWAVYFFKTHLVDLNVLELFGQMKASCAALKVSIVCCWTSFWSHLFTGRRLVLA